MRISPHGRYLYIYKVISLLCVLYAVVQFSLLRVIPAVHRPHKIACDAADPLKLHAFPGALRIADVVVFHIPSSSRPLYIVPLFQRKIKMDPSFYRPVVERKFFQKQLKLCGLNLFRCSKLFIRLRRHQLIQLRIFRKAVLEWDDGLAAADKAMARGHVCDIRQLVL